MPSDVPTRGNGDAGRESGRADSPSPPADHTDEKLLESLACRHAVSLPAQPAQAPNWPEERQAEQQFVPPEQLLKPEERAALVEESAESTAPEPAQDDRARRRSLWIGLGLQVLVLLALLGLALLAYRFIRL